MSFTLAGRNVIVTGSARGMGAQFALDLGKSRGHMFFLLSIPDYNQTANDLCFFYGLELYVTFIGPPSLVLMKKILAINPSARVGELKADLLSMGSYFSQRKC